LKQVGKGELLSNYNFKYLNFISQMRLIYQNGFSFEERFMYKPAVYANTIQSMSILLHAVEKLSMKRILTKSRDRA